MAYVPQTNSVVAFQSIPSSMLVGASIIGLTPVNVTNTVSVVSLSFPGTAVMGSVATLQGTNPWIVNFQNSSILATQQGTHIASVVNSNPSSLLVGASIIGLTPVTAVVTGNPSISGTVNIGTIPGSTLAFQAGTWISSTVSSNPSSLLTGASIFGMLPAGTQVLGSVVAYQGAANWNIGGSVLAQQSGTHIASIVSTIPSSVLVGNYGFRNDAVASFLGGNLTWNQIATDSAGRVITKPFTADDTAAFRFTGTLTTTSVMLVKASALGLKGYVTDLVIVNKGVGSTLFQLQDGPGTLMMPLLISAGGTQNVAGITIPPRTATGTDLAFTQQQVQSLIVMINGYQAP